MHYYIASSLGTASCEKHFQVAEGPQRFDGFPEIRLKVTHGEDLELICTPLLMELRSGTHLFAVGPLATYQITCWSRPPAGNELRTHYVLVVRYESGRSETAMALLATPDHQPLQVADRWAELRVRIRETMADERTRQELDRIMRELSPVPPIRP